MVIYGRWHIITFLFWAAGGGVIAAANNSQSNSIFDSFTYLPLSHIAQF